MNKLFLSIALIALSISAFAQDDHLQETKMPVCQNREGWAKLPLLKEGEFSGYHFVYSNKNYDAVMEHNGFLTMLVKKGDDYIGPAIPIGTHYVYQDDPKGQKRLKLLEIKSNVIMGGETPG